MSYPPGMQGGSPPVGPGSQSYGSQPPQPPRSPWSSPVVLAAVAVGVLIVIGAGIGAIMVTHNTTADPPAAATTSTTVSLSPIPTHTVTSTITTVPGGGGASVPTGRTPARPIPSVADTDWQGFRSGPRCDAADDPAIVIGRTARSQVVICQVGTQVGRWYYKGFADGRAKHIDFPTRSGAAYIAEDAPFVYAVSPGTLVITQSGQVVADEAMVEYWTSD